MDEASKERKVAVPQMKDREAWERFCFAAELDPLSDHSNTYEDTTNVVKTAECRLDANACANEVTNGIATDTGAVPVHIPPVATESFVSSEIDRAVVKRKRDLAYQLGISLVKKTDDSASEVTQPCHVSEPIGDTAGSDDEQESSNGDELDDVENEEMTAAIEGAWAEAAKVMQWSGAVNVEPTTTVLLQFDQVLTQRLLALHIDWMEERYDMNCIFFPCSCLCWLLFTLMF